MAAVWSERVVRDGRSVTAYERSDRGMEIWLRWHEPGARSPKRTATGIRTVRDKRGRLLEREAARAVKLADQKLTELLERRRKREAAPLTLQEGIDLAFSDRGLWPSMDGRYARETKKRLAKAVKLLGGPEVLWEDVTPGTIWAIWRRIYREHEKRGDAGGGYNRAEKIVANLLTVATWLASEFPRQQFPRAPRHWKKELREHWAKEGHPIDREAYRRAKRHTPEEVDRIYAARHRKGVDPRARMYLVLGGRLRGGQVDRAMRSHYDLEDGIRMRRGFLGKLTIPYPSERKRVPPLSLNWRERIELERAMRRGYLSDLETAYRAGELDDYAIFPGGKLRGGKAVVERATHPITSSYMIKLFHELERIAKVEVIRGRGRHGLRRFYSDADDEADVTEETKDLLGGWVTGSTTRQRIYKHGQRQEKLAEAARVRARRRKRGDAEGDNA